MDSFSSKIHFDPNEADFQDQYYKHYRGDTMPHAIFQRGFGLTSILYCLKPLRRSVSGKRICPIGISSFPLLQIYDFYSSKRLYV